MKLTNNSDLPAPLVAALTKQSTYVPAANEIRVTELLSPPRQAALKKVHAEALEEDVSDQIWRALGSAFHLLMEQNDSRWHIIKEKRLRIERQGWTISGQFDSFDVLIGDESDGLTDYKLTSVYRVKSGSGVEEWTPQLNIYAHMLRCNGADPSTLQVFCVFRDWSKREAKFDPNYPQKQAMLIPIEQWDPQRCEDYISERLSAHIAARQGNLPDCTPHDRWLKPPKWALQKEGNKRAIKIFDTKEELRAFAESKGFYDGKLFKNGYSEEYRRPQAIRCESYCAVAPFCTQWQNEQKQLF